MTSKKEAFPNETESSIIMRDRYNEDDRYHADEESNDPATGSAQTTPFSGAQEPIEGQEPSLSQEDNDDTLMVCRCETPKILYDLLQSFSKHGSGGFRSGSSGGGSRWAAGTQSEEVTTMHKLHPMTVFCTKTGLTIHSQSSNKQFQASMELPASLFKHYNLMEPTPDGNENENNNDDDDNDLSYDFTIHWQTFMQCLNLLMIGTGGDKPQSSIPASSFFRNHQTPPQPQANSSLTLSYHTSTEVLRLEWEGSSGVVATAAIPGLNPPPSDEAAELSAAFGQSPIVARWLCPQAGHELSETRELDYLLGATTVRLTFSRARDGSGGDDDNDDENDDDDPFASPKLRMSAKGHSGRVAIEIPAPIEFSGDESGTAPTRIAHTYSLAGWKRALQPLELARETCLSVNARGILAVQHQLVVETAAGGYRSKRRSSHGGHPHSPSSQKNPPPLSETSESAFCDFLLVPLEVDEDRNDEDDSENELPSLGKDEDASGNRYGDNDDRTLTPSQKSSTQGTLSQATLDHSRVGLAEDDEDEGDFQPSAARKRNQPRRRRILSSTQETEAGVGDEEEGDDETFANASVLLPIGSDDEEERNTYRDEPAPRRNLLFPTVAEATSGTGREHRRRERRKRQRLSHQSSHVPGGTVSAEPAGENLLEDDESQERSVNLLDDDDEDDTEKGENGETGDYNDDDDDDEERYCSSPELVYGQQG